ncbi:MAG: hypothetical protein M0P15_04340 [Bacteroides sp.]|nr:hypothetical protein [Bacteroides sp.]
MKKYEFMVFDSQNNSSYMVEEYGENVVDAIDEQTTCFYRNTTLLKVRHTHDNVLELTHDDNSISYLVYTPWDDEFSSVNKHTERHPYAESISRRSH